MSERPRVDWTKGNAETRPRNSLVVHCMNCGHIAKWHQPACASPKCECGHFKKMAWRFTIPANLERDIPISYVVYYVGDPTTQLVKIGSTRNMQNRLREHRRVRPEALLLATEPGDGELERDRHSQFRGLLNPLTTGEREWFRKAPILMEHIGALRLKWGILSSDKPIARSWIAPLSVGYIEPGTWKTNTRRDYRRRVRAPGGRNEETR